MPKLLPSQRRNPAGTVKSIFQSKHVKFIFKTKIIKEVSKSLKKAIKIIKNHPPSKTKGHCPTCLPSQVVILRRDSPLQLEVGGRSLRHRLVAVSTGPRGEWPWRTRPAYRNAGKHGLETGCWKCLFYTFDGYFGWVWNKLSRFFCIFLDRWV